MSLSEPLTHHSNDSDDSEIDLDLHEEEGNAKRIDVDGTAESSDAAAGTALSDAVSKGLGIDADESESSNAVAPQPSPPQSMSHRSHPSSSSSVAATSTPPHSHHSASRRTSVGGSHPHFQEERVCWNRLQLPFFNILCMSVAFMLLFTAFNTVQSYVTSLLPDGLGSISLAVCYSTVVVVTVFAPAMVNFLGEPVAMLLGAGCYCIYMASLITLDRTLLLICSVILGFGGSLLWVSQASFLTRCSADADRGRNTGIFWSLFQMSAVIGNLSAFAVFQHVTSTQLFTLLCVTGCCGALMLMALKPLPERFYPKDNSSYATGRGNPASSAAVASAVSAQEVAIQVSQNASVASASADEIDDEDSADVLHSRDASGAILPLPAARPLIVPILIIPTTAAALEPVPPSVSSLVREVFHMFGDSRILLLIPAFVFLGIEYSFWNGEFPQLLPRENIGLVMCMAGVMEVVGGTSLGWISDRFGRVAAFGLGAFVYMIGLILTSTHLMFNGSVAPAWQDVRSYAYISAACFGFGDAAFNTQVYSLVGFEFSRNGQMVFAFAVFNFCVNVGMAFGFFYGLSVPMHSAKGTLTQIYVQMALLLLAGTGFVVCERRCEKKRILAAKAARSRRHSASHDHSVHGFTAHSVQ